MEALDGGSINIFYNTITKKGTINTIGGSGGTRNSYSFDGPLIAIGGNGGNGSSCCGNISTGTYKEYEENIE